MASTIDKIKNDIIEAVNASQKQTSAYDTEAEVVRIDGNTAWVHIAGGVSETPVAMTINAQKGDKVQVRVSNEGAWIMGNATAPPTDDTKAEEAQEKIAETNIVVEEVKTVVEDTQKIAGNTSQYFWHTPTGTDTGAHITEIPQEDFIKDPQNGGGNLLARSNGIAVRDGLTELATFSASGARIGQTSETHVEFDEDSFVMLDSSGDEFAHIGSPENAYITDTFIYVISPAIYFLSDTPTSQVIVKKNGADATIGIDYRFEDDTTFVGLNTTIGDEYTVTYIPAGGTKYYTFGKRNGNAGNWSLAEGHDVTANGAYSHAEGESTKASGKYSHAEGSATFASGVYAHAEGRKTSAIGHASHAEGIGTKATGTESHAEGLDTVASGTCSHAEGNETVASVAYTHAGGSNTIAGYQTQTVIGRYNDNKSNTVFEIGNGTATERANAFTVDWNGNVKAAGNFYATNHTNPIGWYDAHNNTTTLSNGTSFVKLSNSDITLDPGRYIITGSVRFNGATSGYRGITIRDSNGVIDRASVTQQTIPSSSWTTSLNTTIIYIASSQTTVSLMAYQNSGSSLGISWDIYAICIK